MSRRDGDLLAPDLAKALGIFLVVVGHVLIGLLRANILPESPGAQAVIRAIYVFHMPLFFFIAGMLFKTSLERTGYPAVLKRKTLLLGGSLIVWSYIQFGLQYLFRASANVQLTTVDVLTAPFPPRQQFWFLGALLVLMAFTGAWVARPKASRNMIAAGIVFLAARLWGSDAFSALLEQGPWLSLAAQVCFHAPYFLWGAALGTKGFRSARLSSWQCGLLLAMMLVLEQSAWESAWLSAVASFVCVFAVYRASQNLEVRFSDHVPHWAALGAGLGRNSMIIYLAHVICAAAWRAALLHLGVDNVAAHSVGGVFVGLFLPLTLVPLGRTLRSSFPRFSSVTLPVS